MVEGEKGGKMTPEQVDKLITFGQMALEQGWYDQARDYFEQALALDASNREAIKGLARVNEILTRKAATAVKPIQVEPVKPPRKVERERSIPEKKREGQERSLTQWFKGQSRRRKLVILASTPLLFLCLCAMLAEMISPTPKPTPIPGMIATPMPTAMPIQRTRIPIPLPPTSTPKPKPPTNTPIPPTPTPGFSAEEQAYALTVAEITADYADSFNKVSALTIEAGENAWLILNDEWKLEMAVGLAIWQICGDRIRALKAPSRLQGIHQNLVEATKHIDRAGTLLAQGIDEIDADKINGATEEMLLGNAYINQATVEINALQASK